MVSKQTVTLANSIVGVSVLAMPFCFKQCGIILATIMLILGAVVTRTVCYFLLKAGIITRRRNYEMLAWHTFGQGGKFIVEISIIGFLIGTLIAFYVVMGDLGPEIVSEVFTIENNNSLRIVIMSALSLFVALPLGLLRNIDSLGSVSSASVLFYVFLVFKILSEGLGPLFSGSYLDRIDYWRPAGLLTSIPILSMALSCQTQIFAIYESLPDPSLQKMNEIVKQAVTICTAFYFCVGFFGYIAFCHQSFGGNILMTFASSWTTQLIKLCFLMSIVFSVPLVVFPCRASLNSLMFRRVHNMHHSLHDVSTNYIPDGRLKFLTVLIIGFTLVAGIMIPNIELVLGLVGSTTGTVICIIFPSIMFIRVISKQTTERLLAQIIFITGVVTMVVSTYATLYAVDQAQQQIQLNDPLPDQIRVAEIIKEARNDNSDMKASFQTPDTKIVTMSEDLKNKLDDLNKLKKEQDKPSSPIRSSSKPSYESDQGKPVQQNFKKVQDGGPSETKVRLNSKENLKPSPLLSKVNDENDKVQPKPNEGRNIAIEKVDVKDVNQPVLGGAQEIQDIKSNAKNTYGANDKDGEGAVRQPILNPVEKSPVIEKDAAVEILKKLEVHQENQKKLLEEQRKILEELKEHHEQDIHRQQQSDVMDKKAPLKVDELINAVGGESKKEQPIDQSVIDKKVEVLQQEKLIEKFSKNIEKEKENVKIIEKIEAGLNKEIVKVESEPKLENKIKLPEPVPVQNNPELPVAVGERIGQLMSNIEPSPNLILKIPDTIIQVDPAVGSNAGSPKEMLKPIPIKSLDLMPKPQQNITSEKETGEDAKIAKMKPDINEGSQIEETQPVKEQLQQNQLDKKQPEKSLAANSNTLNKLPKVSSESPKQVDRDI